MVSREEIEELSFVLTLHLNDKGIELWNKIKKDLEVLEKQDKILSILKNKKVDIKLVLWAGQKVEAYNVAVRERKYFPREELTQEEFDDIKEWLNNEK